LDGVAFSEGELRRGNPQAGTVSVIDTATDTVTNTIAIGPETATTSTEPTGVAFSPDGSVAYVANTIIDQSANTVTGQVSAIPAA
jgi:YVTN family beta-propeller protein